jgi:ATP-dependent Clp protease adapter protein ClpS
MGLTHEEIKKETETTFNVGKPFRVILFNDEAHSMGEVAAQIIRAISCPAQKAWEIMMTAHAQGRAEVLAAHRERCEHVAAVLEEIRLGVKVEPV